MAQQKKHVFILGSTGVVGRKLTEKLVESEKIAKIHAPVRSHLDLNNKKIITHDFSQIFKPWHYDQPITDFFYCFGSTLKKAGNKESFKEIELSIAHQTIMLVKQMGVQRFYLISSKNVSSSSHVFYLKVKAEVEKILKDHQFKSFFLYRPSLILGPRNEIRPLELVAQKTLSPFSPFLQKYLPSQAPIKAEQLAKAMIEDFNDPLDGFVLRENKQIVEMSN